MAWPFQSAVDPTEVPDYYEVIKDPMGELPACTVHCLLYMCVYVCLCERERERETEMCTSPWSLLLCQSSVQGPSGWVCVHCMYSLCLSRVCWIIFSWNFSLWPNSHLFKDPVVWCLLHGNWLCVIVIVFHHYFRNRLYTGQLSWPLASPLAACG